MTLLLAEKLLMMKRNRYCIVVIGIIGTFTLEQNSTPKGEPERQGENFTTRVQDNFETDQPPTSGGSSIIRVLIMNAK